MIVMVQLFLHGAVLGRSLVELALESDRGVVSTENLRAEALHVRLQVLVQIAGLYKADTISASVYTAQKDLKH